MASNREDQVDVTLTFAEDYGNHSVSAMGGYQYLNANYSGFSAFRDNFLFPDYTVLSAGSSENMRNGGYAGAWSLVSYFGRVNYAFAGKYLFEANVRHDGSSRLAEGTKWSNLPSLSAGWRLSEESFLAGTRAYPDDLQIRASGGRLGTDGRTVWRERGGA